MGTSAVAHAGPEVEVDSQESRWREALAPYARADVRRSLICLATSVVPYFALMVAMWLLLPVSYALVLLLAIPASGFLVRTFIIFHDCTHGSFLPSKRANTWVGVLVGLIVYSPFHAWGHEHARHHASSGDLDRRGLGDIDTWTVAEYRSKPWLSRLGYRLLRSPFVMFTLGPIWSLALEPRIVPIRARPRIRRSHLYTDLGLLAVVGGIIMLIGWRDFLLLQVPAVTLGGAAGVWLFYVQHQFEGVYWERSEDWNYIDAALAGSSYLKLPKVLQFFTGNIGLHHIHHLLARIPNYNLQRAHDENQFLHRAPTMSLWDGLRTVRLKLYDEDSRRMVTFAQAREGAV
ncbi:MAG TPA: fatty acid desaturase [Solirubrobacteraceae bacterium]|nr:fatty acid desaturase [Solirubrobacteraceae bacterium]